MDRFHDPVAPRRGPTAMPARGEPGTSDEDSWQVIGGRREVLV